MKRFLTALLLVLCSQAASAAWALLGRNEDLRLFIDHPPVQRAGDVATVWQMIDYTSAQWIGAGVVMSIRQLVEYDCKARRARTVAMVAFSEQMGAGREVHSERTPDAAWSDISAGSSGETLLKVACGVE